ncbi:MAG: DUF1592 domain-containing protein [Gammaproteobacteria bacterium]
MRPTRKYLYILLLCLTVAACGGSATQESAVGSSGSSPFFAGVGQLDNEQTLRKAAILLAGRLPTSAESAAVAGSDESTLRTAVRALMRGENFDRFLMETANDHFLTEKFAVDARDRLDAADYPNLTTIVDGDVGRVNRALAQETQQLVRHIVNEERPYTEVLTADYIMVNPYSASVLGAVTAQPFDDPANPGEWKEGRMNHRLGGPYPHAGILTSPMWLLRFPSTDTNRNRARSRWAYQFFLGINLDALAERSMSPDALQDEDNPTLNNPNCTVCHAVVDPAAGAFQNWGNEGRWRPNELGGFFDTLPASYKRGERDENGDLLYQAGDLWYRTMLPPGFTGAELPAGDNDNALQWLALEFTADPRFATGTIRFWFEGLFGHSPLGRPGDPNDSSYEARLAAHNAQQDIFNDIAERFRQDHGLGPYNLKDLLADLIMSRWFRAAGANVVSTQRETELAQVGMGRLLTPEQLDRKLRAVTGATWDELLDEYRLLYGGFDSDAQTERTTQINSLMSLMIDRMANEMACEIVRADFAQAPAQRGLFPHVESGDLPGDANGEANIRRNLQHLHGAMLGENLAVNDPEIDRSFALFSELVAVDYGNSNPGCNVDDPNNTLRAWMIATVYLLSDYRFLYE